MTMMMIMMDGRPQDLAAEYGKEAMRKLKTTAVWKQAAFGLDNMKVRQTYATHVSGCLCMCDVV